MPSSPLLANLRGGLHVPTLSLDALQALAPSLMPNSALDLDDATPYARRVLWANDSIEVLLVHWRGDVWSAIHDHGGAAAQVYPLLGTLEERCVDPMSGRVTHERVVTPGQQATVDQGGFHQMRGTKGALSLHVYTPAPRQLLLLDPVANKQWTVTSEHGAWLPVDPRYVLAEAPWRR